MKNKHWMVAAAILSVVLAVALGLRLRQPVVIPEEEAVPAQASVNVGRPTYDDLWLLSRVVSGEARSEPYTGQVAVAAVVLNRVKSPEFPATVSGVVYDQYAFESVSNGFMWAMPPTNEHISAAQMALDGWDPTHGSLYFWNPAKKVSPWIWSRNVITAIGRHVFGI